MLEVFLLSVLLVNVVFNVSNFVFELIRVVSKAKPEIVLTTIV